MNATDNLYNLDSATAMQPPIASRHAPLRLVQAQIDDGFATLRFKPGLERDFHRYLRGSSRLSRAVLIVVIASGIVACALLDVPWLGLPDELITSTRITQFAVMLPTAIACAYLCLRAPASMAMEIALVVMFVVATLGLLGQRVIDARAGFILPLELVGVVAVAMLSLSRLRLWIQAPVVIGVAALTFAVDAMFVALDSGYHLFTTALFFVVALLAGYSQEHNLRWTWLNGVQLNNLSRLDPLTGLYNRYALEKTLSVAGDHARRDRRPYAVAMIDIDAFGAYNNHYGHQFGDAALEQVADTLVDHARRPMDCCGRYGGEEFVLLWIGCDASQADMLAESLRAAIEARHIVHAHSPAAPWVTVSIGVCQVGRSDLDAPLETVLQQADRLMFEAKAAGRNRVRADTYRGPNAAQDRAGRIAGAPLGYNPAVGGRDHSAGDNRG